MLEFRRWDAHARLALVLLISATAGKAVAQTASTGPAATQYSRPLAPATLPSNYSPPRIIAPATRRAALAAPWVAATAPAMVAVPRPARVVPMAPQLGGAPRPTPEVRQRFNEWVQQVVDPENTLDLVVSKPRILVLKQAPQKVQIPDEKVAAYDVLSERELSVIGVSVGTTVLNIWFEDKNAPGGHTLLSYFVRVVPDPEARTRLERAYVALEQDINRTFPDSRITLSLVGENVLVNGQAKDAADADKIIRLIESNLGAGSDNPDERNESDQGPTTAPTLPGPRDYLTNPSGSTGRSNRARARGGATGRRAAGGVINMLRVPGANQVMLRVTVAEVNRSAARSIGLNFTVTNNKGQNIIQNLTGRVAANLPMILDNGQVAVELEALRNLSLAKSLAEPNLVAVNGQSASFHAGGQFPVPVVTGATATGLQGVSFIPFGIQLSFTPYITDRDRMRLVLSAEVSTRDASTGTNINGANVPSLSTRNFQSTVDLKSGQTLAVAGLIQQNLGSSGDHVPGIGDLPILSALLGSNRTSAAEQELVMLVTADFVEPIDKHDVPPLPGSDIYEPSDIEFFLQGRLESMRYRDYRSPVRTDFRRMLHYERIKRDLIIGDSGHCDGRTGIERIEKSPAQK